MSSMFIPSPIICGRSVEGDDKVAARDLPSRARGQRWAVGSDVLVRSYDNADEVFAATVRWYKSGYNGGPNLYSVEYAGSGLWENSLPESQILDAPLPQHPHTPTKNEVKGKRRKTPSPAKPKMGFGGKAAEVRKRWKERQGTRFYDLT